MSPAPSHARAAAQASHLPVGRALRRACACGARAAGTCEACKKRKLRRKGSFPSKAAALPASVQQVLHEPGQALEAPVRQAMESRFQHDFSRVRVHRGGLAAQSAQDVDALAFTVGEHIVFGRGAYRPQVEEGQRLLAHELAHTLQQRGLGHGLEGLDIGHPHDPAEREADALADRAVAASAQGSLAAGAAAAPMLRRRVSPSLPRLREDLSTGIFNSVSEEEAHDALGILSPLSDQDLGDTMEALERADSDAVDHFYGGLSQADIRANQDQLRRIKNHRFYTRTTRSGGTTVTTELRGSCNFSQGEVLGARTRTALQWLDRAVARMNAYIANNAADAPVGQALQQYFFSATPQVAAHVRARLNQIRTDMRSLPGFTVECHGSWDLVCGGAAAYIPGGEPERMVLCPSFFSTSEVEQVAALVHEMSHTQVGGQHITDRAYTGDRLIQRLRPEEALTNAASYELLVRRLATGTDATRPPQDTFEDCPADWQDLLREAAARAERSNRNAHVHFSTTSAANLATRLNATELGWMPGQSQDDVDRALRIYREGESRFGQRIDFECEPEGGGRCDRYLTYWWATGDFHICPSWKNQPTPEAREISLLAGLYGYWRLEGDDPKRWNYARIAHSLTQRLWAAPTLPQVMGDPAWNPDELKIQIQGRAPAAINGQFFHVWGPGSRLITSVLPRYEGPDCHTDPLPLEFQILFAVDSTTHQRPLPFTPPTARVEVDYRANRGSFTRRHEETRARYSGQNAALGTRFPSDFAFTLPGNGDFQLTATLQDPDAAITRTFADTIPVVSERPCAAASLVSDPRARVLPADQAAVQDLLTFLRDAQTRIQGLLANPPAGEAWIAAANPHIQSLQDLLTRLIGDLDQARIIVRFDQPAAGSVAARYEPTEDTLHLRPAAGPGDLPILASSLVHEYAHAMQDRSLEQIQMTQRAMATHERQAELQQEIESRRQESYFLRLLTASGVAAGAGQEGFNADLSSRVWVGRFERERTGTARERRAATREIERELSGPYAAQLQANAPAALYPIEISEANHALLYRPVGGVNTAEDLGALPLTLQTLDQLTNHLSGLVSGAAFFAALFQGPSSTTYVHAIFTVFYRQRRLAQFALAPPAAPPAAPPTP